MPLLRRIGPQLGAAWDAAWFGPIERLPLALFRIGFGLLWIDIIVSSYPNWSRFYGRDGIVPFAWLGEEYFARPSLLSISSSDLWTTAFFWFALAAAVAFTIGFKTRIATILLYAAVISMINRTPTITHGEDLVSRPLLFFACFAPLGDRLSIDAWLRARSGARTPAAGAVWPQRLMQISLLFVYVFSVPAKPSDDTAWLDGTALYYVMASANWGRFPELARLFYSGPLSAILTASTLAIEGTFPILVWRRRTRPYALAALGGLQLGIAILVNNVFNFNLIMLIGFILFVPDPALERVSEWLQQVRLRARGAIRARTMSPSPRSG